MARRRRAPKRTIAPDYKYHSVLASKFINDLMNDGKKTIAEGILYKAIDLITERTGTDGIEVFNKAINNVKPMVEVRPRRVGGATYQVPVEVRADRRISLAIKWVIKAVRNRGEYTTEERLCNELISASRKEGVAYKKKEDTHRMAEANKAFAHFGW
ncbi:30S ribosomal protein S7 [candidate division WOR-3 bacterium]|jgi:small subunit ribosomal protein S7|nr:30S ribosomal protein S7 [candidate division WOR-3 bacterium]